MVASRGIKSKFFVFHVAFFMKLCFNYVVADYNGETTFKKLFPLATPKRYFGSAVMEKCLFVRFP